MRNGKMWSALACTAMLAAGCDPEAPVQSSNVTDEIEGAIAEHAANPTTHTNLLFPAANIDGEITGDQLEDGTIGIAQIGIDAVGSEEIANQSISQADMSSNAIGTLQIQDDAITNAKIAANAITAAELAAGAVSGGVMGSIADNSITTADVLNDSLTGADINDGTIASADITDDTITDNDITNDSLTAASLANDSVGANELANNAVDANALQTDAVTTAKIMNDNVTTAKIANLSVTQSKIDSDWSGQRVDPTTGAFTTVFSFDNNTGGTLTVVAKGLCDSDQAGAQVQLFDGAMGTAAACPDTNLTTPEVFSITKTVADGDTMSFRYDAGANNATVRWRLLSITF